MLCLRSGPLFLALKLQVCRRMPTKTLPRGFSVVAAASLFAVSLQILISPTSGSLCQAPLVRLTLLHVKPLSPSSGRRRPHQPPASCLLATTACQALSLSLPWYRCCYSSSLPIAGVKPPLPSLPLSHSCSLWCRSCSGPSPTATVNRPLN